MTYSHTLKGIFECPEELKGQLKIGDFYG